MSTIFANTNRIERIDRMVEANLFHLCFNAQMWTCAECGRTRQWGVCQPWDSTLKPVLGCDTCHDFTRHAYRGVGSR